MSVNEKLISDVHGIVKRLAGSDLPVPHDLAELVHSVSKVLLRFITDRRNHKITPEQEQKSLNDITVIANRFASAGHTSVADFIRDKFYFSEGTSMGEAVSQQRVETAVEIPSAKITSEEEQEKASPAAPVVIGEPEIIEFNFNRGSVVDSFEMNDSDVKKHIPEKDELVLQPFSKPAPKIQPRNIVKEQPNPSLLTEKQLTEIDKVIVENGSREMGLFSRAELYNFGEEKVKHASVPSNVQEALRKHHPCLSLEPIRSGDKTHEDGGVFEVKNEILGLYLGGVLVTYFKSTKKVALSPIEQYGQMMYCVNRDFERVRNRLIF